MYKHTENYGPGHDEQLYVLRIDCDCMLNEEGYNMELLL